MVRRLTSQPAPHRTRTGSRRPLRVAALSLLALSISTAAAAQSPSDVTVWPEAETAISAAAYAPVDLLGTLSAPESAYAENSSALGAGSAYDPSEVILVPNEVDTSRPASPRAPLGAAVKLASATDVQSIGASLSSLTDIPDRALQAYQMAAATMARVNADCALDWSLLAALGSVESNHGAYRGSLLADDGLVSPRIRGRALNGRGVAKIKDSDAGALDGDRKWDRAVGPLQFIPATWAAVGVDADDDGVRNPDDLDDAALAAAVYLCAAAKDLSASSDLDEAVYSYNRSRAYVRSVLGLADVYRAAESLLAVQLTTAPGSTRAVGASTALPHTTAAAQPPKLSSPARPGRTPKPAQNGKPGGSVKPVAVMIADAPGPKKNVKTPKPDKHDSDHAPGSDGHGTPGAGSGGDTSTDAPSTGGAAGEGTPELGDVFEGALAVGWCDPLAPPLDPVTGGAYTHCIQSEGLDEIPVTHEALLELGLLGDLAQPAWLLENAIAPPVSIVYVDEPALGWALAPLVVSLTDISE